MRVSALTVFLARVRVSAPIPGVSDLADGVLLQRFLDDHDEGAFEELVRRHGPMVLGVCRRRLGHEHDAEEAFQATFLLLACKAGSVVPRQQVGAWLHGVACRAAAQAARSAKRRQRHESRAAAIPRRVSHEDHGELREVIDEEVARLPERYRSPLVLCLLEGRTPREAARLLGWPEGSVSGRLTRAKRLLGRRLEQRGYGPADAATLAAPALSAERLASAALASAARLAGPEGLVPVRVAALMQEVCQVMWRTTMQKLIAVTLAVALAGAGVVIGLAGAAGPDETAPQERRAAEPSPRPEKPAKTDELPTGAAPTQVLARLEGGEVIVRVSTVHYALQREVMPGGAIRTSYTPIRQLIERRFADNEVTIQNARGKAVSKREAEKLLKKDRVAVAAIDGKPVDPLHLRILKDDVPVLILPAPPAQAVPPVAVPGVMIPPPPAPPVQVAVPSPAPPAVVPPPAAPAPQPPPAPRPRQ